MALLLGVEWKEKLTIDFIRKINHTIVLGMEFTMMTITYFIIIYKLGANVLKAVHFILNFSPLEN